MLTQLKNQEEIETFPWPGLTSEGRRAAPSPPEGRFAELLTGTSGGEADG